MKAYTFIHSYIHGIQVGIQGGHVNVELMRQNPPADSGTYSPDDSGEDELVQRWATSYKTFVWLEGGDSDSMCHIIDRMQLAGAPYAYFNEPAMKCSAADINDAGMVTAATVLLTTEQVDQCAEIRSERMKIYAGADNNKARFVGEHIMTDWMDIHLARLLEVVAGSRRKTL